jgi:hypothetical protein
MSDNDESQPSVDIDIDTATNEDSSIERPLKRRKPQKNATGTARENATTSITNTTGSATVTVPTTRTCSVAPRVSVPNQYKGYSLQTSTPSESSDPCCIAIATSQTADTRTPEAIWSNFISRRKPCVITTLPPLHLQHDNHNGAPSTQNSNTASDKDTFTTSKTSTKPIYFDVKQLVHVAGQEIVQIERRLDKHETFGQNRSPGRQLEMSVKDFCHKLDQMDGDLLYLSTQETNDDDNIFLSPCKQLLDNNLIPSTLAWAGNLKLQSCNLWIGKSENKGTSSGLHHDFHDNFYLLIHGTKSFRLFSPDSARHMQTYGTMDRIHPNGLISYVGSETRPDGSPLEPNDEDSYDDVEEDEENNTSDEEIVIGNGFDYNSDADEEGNCNSPMGNSRDDYDDIVGLADDSLSKRPNNFSRIDLQGRSLVELTKEYPAFANVNECVVHLQAGQTLYLPAGWFHEVTSISAHNDYHMALNYWFDPPDNLHDFNSPYTAPTNYGLSK